MLLGLPSSMVDEEVASLKTEKESRNTNVRHQYILVAIIITCNISVGKFNVHDH